MNVVLGILAFVLALFCGYYGTLIWEEELSQNDETVEAFQENEEYAGVQGDYVAPQVQSLPEASPVAQADSAILPEVVDSQPTQNQPTQNQATQSQPLPEPSVYAELQAPVQAPVQAPAQAQTPAPVQSQSLEQDVLPEPQGMVAPLEQKAKQSSSKKYEEDTSQSLLNSITNLMGDPKQAKTSTSRTTEDKPSTSTKEASAKPNDSGDSLLNSINNLMK